MVGVLELSSLGVGNVGRMGIQAAGEGCRETAAPSHSAGYLTAHRPGSDSKARLNV